MTTPRKDSKNGMSPTRNSKIAAFVVLALVVVCPLLWSLASDPILEAASPIACPEGSKLVSHSERVLYDDNGEEKKATRFNFECVDAYGQSVDSNVEIILFLACAGPFVLLLASGVIGSFLQKGKKKT